MRRAALAALALALVLAAPARAAEPQASLTDIEDEVMCVVCGVPLELATEAPQAIQERNLIRRLIEQGLTKEEIKDRLVAESRGAARRRPPHRRGGQAPRRGPRPLSALTAARRAAASSRSRAAAPRARFRRSSVA
jgi:hypothetical protein